MPMPPASRRHRRARRLHGLLLLPCLLLPLLPVHATHAADSTSAVQQADALLSRADEAALDGVFQALHGVSRSPQDAARLCQALAGAGQSDAWLRLPGELSPLHQQALADAFANLLLSAWIGQPREFDEAAAQRSLRQAGVRAALLDADFSAATLAGPVQDPADEAFHQRRCASMRALLDALAGQPREERAAVTRLLLRDGLAVMIGTTAGN
ncbi:hypothetical protein [Luteimonas sp. e5]